MSNINKIKKITVKATKSYRTKAQKQEDEKKRKLLDKSPAVLALYICGILGIVLCAGEAIGLSLPLYFILIGVTSLITTGLWYLYFYRSRLFIIASIILISASCFVLIPQIYSISRYLRYMIANNFPISNLLLNSGFMIALSLLIIYLLFALEFVLRNHSIMFSVGLAILIAVPVAGYEIGIFPLILLMIFETGFFVLNMTERRRLRDSLVMDKKSRAGMLSAILTAAIITAVFVPAFVLEKANEEPIFRSVYHADGYIKDIMAKLFNTGIEDVSGGKLNRGNLYRTGQQMLEVNTDNQPSDRIYLQSFHGKEYTDSEWTPAFEMIYYDLAGEDEEPFEENEYEYYDRYQTVYQEPFMYDLINNFLKNHSSNAESLKSSYQEFSRSYMCLTNLTSDPISEMYFMLADNSSINTRHLQIVEDIYDAYRNYIEFYPADSDYRHYMEFYPTDSDTFTNPDAVNLNIKHTSEDYSTALFIPYYSSKSVGRIWSTNDITRENGYTVPFLTTSQIDMSEKWDTSPSTKTYEQFTDAYIRKTKEEYLSYPEETLSRLKNYCNDTPLTDVDEITTYILVTLQNKAEYSTTPGTTPYNKDVVDYFLFENGMGYCVHFASTAALMYRMYGIPARYVTGFVVEPELFKPDSNGNYTAAITDEYAHAWVEIFLKDYGWVPVEVTPTQSGSMIASYPGYNTLKMRSIMEKHGWTFRNSDKSDADGGGFGGNFQVNGFVGIILLSVPFAAILGLIVFIILRNIIYRKRLSIFNCRKLFDLTIKALHFSGIMKDMNGSERDFPEKLRKHISCLTDEDIERFMLTIQAENYSDKDVSKPDRDHMEKCYRLIATELYSNLNLIKKLIFRYLLFPHAV